MIAIRQLGSPKSGGVVYDAFISYSHAADGKLAPALQQGLHRLARPWNRRRALHVFRDETGLSTNPHLWSSIEQALIQSNWFVLLASPESAASEWVVRELDSWLARKSVDHLLLVVTDGEWNWDSTTNELSGSAVPGSLGRVLRDEPRLLDLRWARGDEQLDLRNSRFRSAIADLAAPMHEMPKDDLEGEDVRQHRRALRLARGAIGALALLLLAVMVVAVVALAQRNVASRERGRFRRQSEIADARRVSGLALSQRTAQLDTALLLAVEGNWMHDDPQTRSDLLTTLATSPALLRFDSEVGGTVVDGARGPNGTVVVAFSDGRVRMFDARRHRWSTPARRVIDAPVLDVEFAPDGNSVVVCTIDGRLRVLEGSTLVPRGPVLPGDNGSGACSITFRPDGAEFATTGVSNRLRRWSTASSRLLSDWAFGSAEGGGFPGGAVYLPDGGRIALADVSTVLFIDSASGSRLGESVAVSGSPFSIAVSPTGAVMAVGTGAGDVQLIDLATQTPLGVAVRGHNGPVTGLAFDATGARFVSTGADGRVRVWSTLGPSPGPALTGLSGPASSAWFAGERIVTVARRGLATWSAAAEVAAGRIVPGTRNERSSLTSGGVGMVRRGAAALRGDGRITVVAPGSMRMSSFALTDDAGNADLLAASADGSTLAIGLHDDDPRFEGASINFRVDVLRGAGTRPQQVLATTGSVASIALDASGRHVAVGEIGGSTDRDVGVVEIFDTRTGRRVAAPIPADHASIVWAVGFTHDGQHIATAGRDGTAHLWDARTSMPLGQFGQRRGRPLTSVAADPNGDVLAIGSEDGTVTLFDARSRQGLGTATVLTGTHPTALAFSSSASVLAIGADDGSITLLDVAHRTTLSIPLTGPPHKITGLTFAAGDETLLGSAADGSVLSIDLRRSTWRARACAVAGRNLTHREWRTYVGQQPYRRTCPDWAEGS